MIQLRPFLTQIDSIMPIIFVGLDLYAKHSEYADFKRLSAIEKINHFAAHIKTLCEELKKQHPDQPWIFSWREFGITDGVSREISTSAKKYLKKTFSEITENYPNLTIFAGTVLSEKKGTIKKAPEILSYYQQLKHLEDEENKLKDEINHQVMKHREAIVKLIRKYENNPNTKISIFRNTCYIFSKGKIMRHDKMAPFEETSDHKNAIFKPGGKFKRNINRAITIPLSSGSNFKIAIEICREHGVKTASDALAAANSDLHLIMSASSIFTYPFQCAPYAIHLDDVEEPRLVTTKEIPEEKQNIIFYMNNPLEKNTYLTRIKATYPFRARIIEAMQKGVKEFKKDSPGYKIFEYYFDRVIKNTSQFYVFLNDALYIFYSTLIQDMALDFKKIKDKDTYCSGLWTNNLINKLKESYALETNQYRAHSISTLKNHIVSDLEDYKYSRGYGFFSLFRNTELTNNKIKLAENLKGKICISHDIQEIEDLIATYKKQSEKYEPPRATLFTSSGLEKCFESINNKIYLYEYKRKFLPHKK